MRAMNISILTSLRRFIKPNPEQMYFNEISEMAYQIALTYLKLVHKKFHKFILNNETSIEESAINCIAPIFNKNADGYFCNIKNEMEKSDSPETEEDSLYLLNKITSKFVEQYIVDQLKDSDNYFTYVLDFVNNFIIKNGYKEINYFGKNYIVEEGIWEISGLVIDEEKFISLLRNKFNNKKDLINSVFGYLKNESIYFPAIPKTILVEQLKSNYAEEFTLNREYVELNEQIDHPNNL